MNKKYILKYNLLISDDIENSVMQSKIEEEFEKLIGKLSINLKCDIVNISEQLIDLENNNNYGKCINCGDWTSDHTKDNFVEEFSNGALIDKKWYCDLCLPVNHKNHF